MPQHREQIATSAETESRESTLKAQIEMRSPPLSGTRRRALNGCRPEDFLPLPH